MPNSCSEICKVFSKRLLKYFLSCSRKHDSERARLSVSGRRYSCYLNIKTLFAIAFGDAIWGLLGISAGA